MQLGMGFIIQKNKGAVEMSKRLTDKEKAEVVADFIAVMSKSYISKKFYRYKLVRKKQCRYKEENDYVCCNV
jgi:hypothetical protein